MLLCPNEVLLVPALSETYGFLHQPLSLKPVIKGSLLDST